MYLYIRYMFVYVHNLERNLNKRIIRKNRSMYLQGKNDFAKVSKNLARSKNIFIQIIKIIL